jgi:hypothetical protein
MICLFFKFGQILKFLHLLIARSPKNPMETLATPDGRRQFQGDTHRGSIPVDRKIRIAAALYTAEAIRSAVNHRLKSVVREIRTLRSVGAGGG